MNKNEALKFMIDGGKVRNVVVTYAHENTHVFFCMADCEPKVYDGFTGQSSKVRINGTKYVEHKEKPEIVEFQRTLGQSGYFSPCSTLMVRGGMRLVNVLPELVGGSINYDNTVEIFGLRDEIRIGEKIKLEIDRENLTIIKVVEQ